MLFLFARRALFAATPPVRRYYATMSPALHLEARERLLKDCLAECAQSLPPLEIRFAGGWVRDKLLGRRSNDIDAALSTLSGKDFGPIFLRFYDRQGAKYKEEAARLGVGNAEVDKIVLLEEDAERSKHLAVAKMRLFDLEVDLVNLRTEVYASDSRTPVVEMGTAEEDALRRDATINALFYNIHTEQVEDLTGRGLEDLKNKLLRTPLDPYQTFRDDPLRVLRLIRFASKLDFQIDPAAKLAMKSPEIHKALKLKISRERVRAEIIKALDGPGPANALLYIHELDLYSACFGHPTAATTPSAQNLPQTYHYLGRILENPLLSVGLRLRQDQDRTPPSIPWLLAAYTPWADQSPSQASEAMKEGMKATVHEARLLTAAMTHRRAISDLVSAVSRPEKTVSRGQIGMALRRWGPAWGHQALFALLCDLQTDGEACRAYEAFVQQLQRLGLDGARTTDEKPVLDGRQIKELLARDKAGPGNRFAADLVMEWQLDHPGRDVADCVDMVRAKRSDILAWEQAHKKTASNKNNNNNNNKTPRKRGSDEYNKT